MEPVKKILLQSRSRGVGVKMSRIFDGKSYTAYFSAHKDTGKPMIVEVAKALGYHEFGRQLKRVMQAADGLPIITLYAGDITNDATYGKRDEDSEGDFSDLGTGERPGQVQEHGHDHCNT